jgi:hypothetical protein
MGPTGIKYRFLIHFAVNRIWARRFPTRFCREQTFFVKMDGPFVFLI